MKRLILVAGALAAGCLIALIYWPRADETPAKSEGASNQAPRSAVSLPGPSADGVSKRYPVDTNLPPVLATAVGKGEVGYYRARLAAVNQLGTNLSEAERRALYDHLRDTSEDNRLRPGQAVALKNDILNKLRQQEPPPAELTGIIADLFHDENQPAALCDYALQHLAAWYDRIDPDQKARVIMEIEAAANERRQSYAGTALLGLLRLQNENRQSQNAVLTNGVVALVADDQANPLARITAVQIAGRLGLTNVQSQLERFTVDESQADTLRLAAVGALGTMPGASAQACLPNAANSVNVRIKRAAKLALASAKRSSP